MVDLDRAVLVATKLHAGQRRKYTFEPYICHCLEVVSILAAAGIRDERLLAAGVLHDTIEDCGVSATQLVMHYDIESEVVDLVVELSEPDHQGNRATRKALEAERLSKISPDAQTIKYADLLSNTRSIVGHDPGFAKIYLKEKKAILEVMREGQGLLRLRVENQLNQHFNG